MNRRLAWTAAIALTTSAVSLVAAAWIASAAPNRMTSCLRIPFARTFGFDPSSLGDDGRSGQPGTVTLPWDGGDTIAINLPATVHYKPGAKAEAIISGDSGLIRHVRLRNGSLGWDVGFDCYAAERIVVQLTGPPIATWRLHGATRLELSAIEQDALNLKINGSGRVIATGTARLVSLDVAGSGKADLSKLTARRSVVAIHGSGDAAIAPQDEADIRISGSGVITLHSNPGQVQTHISGSGRIRRAP